CKYQISIDGTVTAYRYPYLLTGSSLILKQDSSYYEHYYADLIPYKHYISIKKDLSDLLEKLKWARENDEEVQRIIKRAQRFSQKHSLPNHILCYHMKIFQ
ncbi:unnamed protein product, partial [Didymodactylos carnosus]